MLTFKIKKLEKEQKNLDLFIRGHWSVFNALEQLQKR